jgi:hypothetical protein
MRASLFRDPALRLQLGARCRDARFVAFTLFSKRLAQTRTRFGMSLLVNGFHLASRTAEDRLRLAYAVCLDQFEERLHSAFERHAPSPN